MSKIVLHQVPLLSLASASFHVFVLLLVPVTVSAIHSLASILVTLSLLRLQPLPATSLLSSILSPSQIFLLPKLLRRHSRPPYQGLLQELSALVRRWHQLEHLLRSELMLQCQMTPQVPHEAEHFAADVAGGTALVHSHVVPESLLAGVVPATDGADCTVWTRP